MYLYSAYAAHYVYFNIFDVYMLRRAMVVARQVAREIPQCNTALYSQAFSVFQVRNLFVILIGSLLAVCLLQFVNDMIIRSLALSFSAAALVVIATQVCNWVDTRIS